MLAIDTAYGQQFDLDGSPLTAGYIYIGEPNLNPIEHPVPVFWDAAGDQPASQPIRTLNGYPVRSGTPALLYVEDAHSMVVQNSKKVQVVYLNDSRDLPSVQAMIRLNDLALPTGARDIGVDTEDNGAPDGSLQQRIHRDYVNVGDMGGTDPTGAVDNTTQVLAAIATGKLVRLDGFYRISTSLSAMLVGMVGDGPRKSGLICNGVHAITIPSNAGLDRRRLRLENFAIDSLSNSCDDRFAIYAPGVANGAAAVYNSGLYAGGLEIGRTGRMGGIAYLKDFFRVNMEDIGGTDVSWMIRLVGSVVQIKLRNITTNNDNATLAGVPTLVTAKYGISTETAIYSSGTMTAENVRAIDCSYVRGARGINHTAGLDVEFENFDCEADAYGAVLNAACAVRGGILAPGVGATAWVGISRGVSISNPDDMTIIEGVDINCLRSPSTPASSYGLDAGDGVSPVFGLIVRDLRVRGNAGALQSGIRARILSGDAEFYSNRIRHSVCLGIDMDIQSGRTLVAEDNIVAGGTISVSDAGDTTAGGRVINNVCTTLTQSFSNDNFTSYNPAVAGQPTRGASESKGTFAITLTGCTLPILGTARYVVQGRQVSLYVPGMTGTSNATTATLTGLPAAITPNRDQDIVSKAQDNGVNGLCNMRVKTTGVIELFFGTTFAGWTAAGAKGFGSAVTITFSLD